MSSIAKIVNRRSRRFIGLFFVAIACASSIQRKSFAGASRCSGTSTDFLVMQGEVGQGGGRLVISQRSEPRTLNPLRAIDESSREIIGLITADLIHINRYTQKTEPALAESWAVSADGLRYTLHLRCGLRFSDGFPFTADDVVFTFQSYLDKRFHSPQRDLLVISGHPILVSKVNDYTVLFTLTMPYAAADRLFDSIAILPRHLLQDQFDRGTLTDAWPASTRPDQIAGMGPFRLKEYVPGERMVLERNPYYWKKDRAGQRLPYLREIVSLFVPDSDAEAMRFEAGETDVISRLNAADYAVLERDQSRRHFHLHDLGPGLEYDFLFFNQNDFSQRSALFRQEQRWFDQVAFRQAISSAIDRAAIVRLAYRGRAYPLAVQVTPGNKLWVDNAIPRPVRSLATARQLLGRSGFSWAKDGSLVDAHGSRVRFSITVNAGKPEQVEMGTIIQQDLKDLGVDLTIGQLEFHTFLDRIFNTYNYEAAILALADGDADPNSEMNVLRSGGGAHVWCLKSGHVVPVWQTEIDSLMQQQLVTPDYQKRKRLYDRVQQLMWENVPVVCLISPDILVGAKDGIGNFRPALLSSYTLWNAEQLFIRQPRDMASSQ